MKYLLINRQSVDDVRSAGKDLLATLENANDLALIENTIVYLVREAQKGKSFKIRAINSDIDFILDGKRFSLEYEENKKRTISIFIFLVETLNKWNLLYGNKTWEYYNEEAYSKLRKLLRKIEL